MPAGRGISETVALAITAANKSLIRQSRFAPKLCGKVGDRGNSNTGTINCHVTQWQKATIDAMVA